MSDTRKVRTTFEPHREIEVGPAEYLDLARQGLLVKSDTSKEPARRAASGDKENV